MGSEMCIRDSAPSRPASWVLFCFACCTNACRSEALCLMNGVPAFCGNREACESVRRSELHLLKRYVAWIRSILSYMDWHPIKHASRHFISNGLSPSYSPVTLSPFPFALCFSYFSPLATMEFAWNRRSGNETFAYDQRRIYGTPTPHSVQGSGPVQTTASA